MRRRAPFGSIDPELTICGGCRYFEQSVTGNHRCELGLALVNMVARVSCDSFDPYPRVPGETSADLSE